MRDCFRTYTFGFDLFSFDTQSLDSIQVHQDVHMDACVVDIPIYTPAELN